MRFFRRHKDLRTHLILIALAVVLRSFIAPGYMLSISPEGGLGLAFCDGPVAMYQADHAHDHHDHGDDDGAAESHISTSCSFWSTSSLMVINSVLVPDLVVASTQPEQTVYRAPNLQTFISNSRVIRGPPVPFFS